MLRFTLTFLFCALKIHATYVLQDNYPASTFADQFNFFTGDDPTHGYVNYVDKETAKRTGIYKIQDGKVYMGVDDTNVASGRGRDSVRLESKKRYTRGLFILDLQHMPASVCGTWPAFWTFGPDWPNNGEINIIEGVNEQQTNMMTLHTKEGCTIEKSHHFSGHIGTGNCDVNAPGQYTNQGCSIETHDTKTYGSGFNSVGGGVYATEWTSDAIKIWFFPRDSIPADVRSGNPDPSSWSKPYAKFSSAKCNIDRHFRDHQIVFGITFCGDWAGGVWTQQCSHKAESCKHFVRHHPGAFADSYWLINSLKVYRKE